MADAPIVLEVRHHDAGGALPTVVLFHGYGSTPDDIVTFSGVTGSIVWRPVIRPIVGNVEFPGAWADLGAGDTTTTADGDVNTGQLTYAAPTDTLLGQVGLKYQGTARGTLKILVAGIF